MVEPLSCRPRSDAHMWMRWFLLLFFFFPPIFYFFFFFFPNKFFSQPGSGRDLWARGCSHRSCGFSMSCLSAYSTEALSGEASFVLFAPVYSLTSSCSILNFSIGGLDFPLLIFGTHRFDGLWWFVDCQSALERVIWVLLSCSLVAAVECASHTMEDDTDDTAERAYLTILCFTRKSKTWSLRLRLDFVRVQENKTFCVLYVVCQVKYIRKNKLGAIAGLKTTCGVTGKGCQMTQTVFENHTRPFILTQGQQRDHTENVPSHFELLRWARVLKSWEQSIVPASVTVVETPKRRCPLSSNYRKWRHDNGGARKQRAPVGTHFIFFSAHLHRWNSSEDFWISHIVVPLSGIRSLSAAFSPFSHLWIAFSRPSSYFPLTVVRTFIRSQLFPYFTPCQPQVLAQWELRSA